MDDFLSISSPLLTNSKGPWRCVFTCRCINNLLANGVGAHMSQNLISSGTQIYQWFIWRHRWGRRAMSQERKAEKISKKVLCQDNTPTHTHYTPTTHTHPSINACLSLVDWETRARGILKRGLACQLLPYHLRCGVHCSPYQYPPCPYSVDVVCCVCSLSRKSTISTSHHMYVHWRWELRDLEMFSLC